MLNRKLLCGVATVLVVTCFIAVIMQDDPVVKEGYQGEPSQSQNMFQGKAAEAQDMAQWVSSRKAISSAKFANIDHQDDKIVAQKAKEADKKFGVFSKAADAEDFETTETENADVNYSMDAAEAKQKKKTSARAMIRAGMPTNDYGFLHDYKADAIREEKNMAKELMHKRTGDERWNKKLATKEAAVKKKLRLDEKKKARDERDFKTACNRLKKIFINAVPKNKKHWMATDCTQEALDKFME